MSASNNTCPRCGQWRLYPQRCQCRRFECGEPWQGVVESWREVYATEAQEAAKAFAEKTDSEGDYTIIKNGSGEIWTRDESGLVQQWDIEAESVPSYTAHAKKTMESRA